MPYLKFSGWIAVVVLLLAFFGAKGISLFLLPLGLSFYLLFRNYLFSAYGILLALVAVLIQTREAVTWAFGLGGIALLSILPLYILIGLVIGAILDAIAHYKRT